MPEVSVVISTFNRSALLRESLACALGQSDVDVEVIVVDNGSTDATADQLAQHDHPRLRVIRHDRTLGPTAGRNSGLAAASGEWAGFLDDDDLWAPGKLRSQLDEASRQGAGWVYTGCVYIDGARRLLGGIPPLDPDEVLHQLPTSYVIPGGISNVLWRRDVLADGGALDTQLAMTVDWDLSLRLLRTGAPAMVRRPLIAYRQHGRNWSRRAAEFQHEFEVIEHKSADLRQDRPLDRGAQDRFVGSELLRAGARRAAAVAYYRGLRQGDVGSFVRGAGVLLPRRLHPWLRRRFLSDADWLRQARQWLDELPAP